MTMCFTPSSSKRVDVVQNELQVRNFKLQTVQNTTPLRIAGDDDDFGRVRMQKVLAGRRRVKDVFDVSD